jgi:preprotein translocase SecE subunit
MAEMKHVKWPTQNQALIYTGLVLFICTLTALFVSAFDYVFSELIDAVINRI